MGILEEAVNTAADAAINADNKAQATAGNPAADQAVKQEILGETPESPETAED